MNILVLDVAAETGGALTILNTFVNSFRENPSDTYYVCVSWANIKSSNNVIILKFPWVKKSWLHRLWFDYVIAANLIKRYEIDEILSLQNNLLCIKKLPQDLYLHQSLPFTEKKITIFEDYKIWVYQNIVSVFIYKAVKRARKITVQTHWMKQAVINRCNVDAAKIEVSPPALSIEFAGTYTPTGDICEFFYPANASLYKNHITIFKAAELLVRAGVTEFRIKFTLDGSTLPENCRKLYRRYEKYFILSGPMKYEDVLKEYCHSILIFASYIETFGLPLLEAKNSNSPILASDCSFCHEILDGYEKVRFFQPSQAEALAGFMKDFIESRLRQS